MNVVDVAIIVVSYKSADLTIDCLRSIEPERATRRLNLRAIVVDNASGDAPAIAQAITENRWSSWVSLIEAPRNGGFGYGNNLGFERAFASGPPAYFHMLNPDTRVLPGGIAALVDFLEAHPDVGIAGSRQEDINGTIWRSAFTFPSTATEFVARARMKLALELLQPWLTPWQISSTAHQTDWIGGASMMIRRKVLESIGGFDESYFLYFEEVDFCFRARQADFATWYVPESHIMHIAGQSTQITGHQAAIRMPSYWYESRRQCFAKMHGTFYAILVDAAALLAYALGSIKRLITDDGGNAIPHFIGDVIANSMLWPSNRKRAFVRNIPRFISGEGATPHSTPAPGQQTITAHRIAPMDVEGVKW